MTEVMPNMQKIKDGVFRGIFSFIMGLRLTYHILSNKQARLNKSAPNFWFWLAISQKLLDLSESYFQHLK